MIELVVETLFFFLFLSAVRGVGSIHLQQAAVVAASCLIYAYKTSLHDLFYLFVFTQICFLGLRSLQAEADLRTRRIKWALLLLVTIGHLIFLKASDQPSPPGISYLTLQIVGVQIWAYFRKSEAPIPWVKFNFSALFFPSLISGPVLRYERIAPQLASAHPPAREAQSALRSAFVLVCFGLFKKTIGDQLGLHLTSESSPQSAQGWYALVAIVAFYLQLYADFSGYSDIARGLARAYGIEIPANFNLPFYAANITEHWKRWHISLNEWFRDHVFTWLFASNYLKVTRYIPGISMTAYLAVSILTTCLLIGAWHGLSFKFFVWSLLNGVLILLHQGLFVRLRFGGVAFKTASIVTTFLLTCFLNALFMDLQIDEVVRLILSSLNPDHYILPFIRDRVMVGYTVILLGFALFGVHELDRQLIKRDYRIESHFLFLLITTLTLTYCLASGAIRQAFLYSRF